MRLTPAEYEALTGGVGLVDVRQRTQIELTGGDRASFLHNLCTNDITGLSPGQGCEIFLTNVQGRILGFGCVFCSEESLIYETVPDQAIATIEHLDRYLIREEVQLHDRTADWGELLLAGAEAADWLAGECDLKVPHDRLEHVPGNLAGHSIHLRRVDFCGHDTFLLQCRAEETDRLRDEFRERGAVGCSHETYEVVRVETGTPWFGLDITDKNLPQELARDDRAISFTKGCYLGQETVARIDALGHVNQLLCGLRFSGEKVPPPQTSLQFEGKDVGQVSSAVFSPKRSSPLALGYIRREQSAPGTRLSSSLGDLEVVSLP